MGRSVVTKPLYPCFSQKRLRSCRNTLTVRGVELFADGTLWQAFAQSQHASPGTRLGLQQRDFVTLLRELVGGA